MAASWITNWKKIKIKVNQILQKRERVKIDPSESLWLSCPSCSKLNEKERLSTSDWICDSCQYYFDRPARAIVQSFGLLKDENFIEPDKNLDSDPLKFVSNLGTYSEKLVKARKKEKQYCSILGYKGTVENLNVTLVCSSFTFLGGSWSHIESSYFQKIVSNAIENKCDVFIMALKTGGVSMFSGAVGLNSVMVGGTIGMQRLKENNILTVGIGQSKTTGGVLASVMYNSDIVIYEKGAHDIIFTSKLISGKYLGPGETIDEKFGTAEEKLSKGMADLVLERSKLRSTILTLAKIIKKKEAAAVINTEQEQQDDSKEKIREILPRTAEKI